LPKRAEDILNNEILAIDFFDRGYALERIPVFYQLTRLIKRFPGGFVEFGGE